MFQSGTSFFQIMVSIVALFHTTSVFLGSVALTSGFTNGAGQIWLDNVQCVGNETRLIDCPASPLGTHNCVHIEDAGVRCLPCK